MKKRKANHEGLFFKKRMYEFTRNFYQVYEGTHRNLGFLYFLLEDADVGPRLSKCLISLIMDAKSSTEPNEPFPLNTALDDENWGIVEMHLKNLSSMSRTTNRIMRKTLCDFLTKEIRALRNIEKDPIKQRFDVLVKELSLSEVEADILCLGVLGEGFLVQGTTGGLYAQPWLKLPGGPIKGVSFYVGHDYRTVREALSGKGRLGKLEIFDETLTLESPSILEYLNGLSDKPISDTFYSEFTDEVLPKGFFGESLRSDGELIRSLFRCKAAKRPVHVLFYGTPGTGKTSFARMIARDLGWKCYEVAILREAECLRGIRYDSGKFRLGALRFCAERAIEKESVVVIDEADRMLCEGGVEAKAAMNSFLDSVDVPCIWIINAPVDLIDESTRRRFSFSIPFEAMDSKVRRTVWDNQTEALGLAELVSPETRNELALNYTVNAGGISMALQNLRDLNPSKQDAKKLLGRLLDPYCKLMEVRPSGEGNSAVSRNYSLAGLNIRGPIALEEIEKAVQQFLEEQRNRVGLSPDAPRMNILLSGPPGTGKTEFVKHLAAIMECGLLVKTGADLFDKFVGGNEKNLRMAFREAESSGKILFLDEIDGLLQSRERAVRGWEVSQVNQLLQLMENFNGVLIGATNFMECLDSAAMRRFTFKLQFDYLDNGGKRIFFERMFDSKLTEGECERLFQIASLAPGDFRTVRQGGYYLNRENLTNNRWIDALADECLRKCKDLPTSTIGFQGAGKCTVA